MDFSTCLCIGVQINFEDRKMQCSVILFQLFIEKPNQFKVFICLKVLIADSEDRHDTAGCKQQAS